MIEYGNMFIVFFFVFGQAEACFSSQLKREDVVRFRFASICAHRGVVCGMSYSTHSSYPQYIYYLRMLISTVTKKTVLREQSPKITD